MSRYRAGRKSRSMYRHYERYGTTGMSKRQLRALAREMDIGVNPRRRYYEGRRFTRSSWNPLSCRMSKRSMFHELKHHGSRPRKHKQRVAIVLSTLRKCGRNPSRRHRRVIHQGTQHTRRWDRRHAWFRKQPMRGLWQQNPKGYARRDHRGFKDGGARRRRKVHKAVLRMRDNDVRDWAERRARSRSNPKRDGSMTRGEKRLAKHADWLREIADRGRKAAMMLKSLKTVPAASHVAAAEHAANKLSEATIEKAMEGVPAAVAKVETVVEHAEAKVIRQRLEDLRILVDDLDTQIKEAEAMNDEALAEELMEQKVKIAKQRTALKQKADGLAIQTNPRRRTVLIGTRAYARALADLKAAIRHRPRRLVTF